MDSLFFDYIKNSHGNDNLDINFSIKRVPLCMANAIRRILISDIPIVAFDDTWDDRPEFRSINIMKNTSGIHNEFLSHRLSLTPICMYKNDLLKIQTKFVKKRQFTFNKKKVPIFKINIKNNQETRSKLNISGSMTITSENIEYLDNSDEYPNIRTFFQPNSISNDFIIIEVFKGILDTKFFVLKKNVNANNIQEIVVLIAADAIGSAPASSIGFIIINPIA